MGGSRGAGRATARAITRKERPVGHARLRSCERARDRGCLSPERERELGGRSRVQREERRQPSNGGARRSRDDEPRRRLPPAHRSEEHTSELQSPCNLVCRLLLEKKKQKAHRQSGFRRVDADSTRGGRSGLRSTLATNHVPIMQRSLSSSTASKHTRDDVTYALAT